MNVSQEIIVGGYRINDAAAPFIIAEAGVNHNGSFELAVALIDAAAAAGADAVKFQTFRAEEVVTTVAQMADYQKRNTGKENSQYAMLKQLELQESWYPALIKRAKEKKIIFLSTPHGGKDSVDLLAAYNICAFKFGSGDLTNLPLLTYAAKFDKPMLISTGMSTLAETKEAVTVIKQAGNSQMLVLHCTTDYPCAPPYVNLRTIQTFMQTLGVLVGYSDHTIGYHAAALAVALGACVIEKHFTLDRHMQGPDHIASTEPQEFKEMVTVLKSIPRNLDCAVKMLTLPPQIVEIFMGSAEKKPQQPELQYMTVARKSIVTSRAIKKGEIFTNENLTIKRPGSGMSPKYLDKIFGKTAKMNIPQHALLQEGMISAWLNQ